MSRKIKIINFKWIRHSKLKIKMNSDKGHKLLLFLTSIIAKTQNKTKVFIQVLSRNCLSFKKKNLSAKSLSKMLKLCS